jgi:hypothetical protein
MIRMIDSPDLRPTIIQSSVLLASPCSTFSLDAWTRWKPEIDSEFSGKYEYRQLSRRSPEVFPCRHCSSRIKLQYLQIMRRAKLSQDFWRSALDCIHPNMRFHVFLARTRSNPRLSRFIGTEPRCRNKMPESDRLDQLIQVLKDNRLRQLNLQVLVSRGKRPIQQ